MSAMNEKVARRELPSVNDTSQPPLASLVNEKKRKVTVIGEEHEPAELQEEGDPSSTVVDAEETLLTPEQIKEFFKATEEGSVERLDELFDKTTIFEPNMTHYTESLLMTAIRAKQVKIAEYLIDQLGINVDHTTELLEFNTRAKIPIREQMLSSRDLAYEEGMMDLVDLIDIVGSELKPCTKRFLQRRLTTCLSEIHQAYLERMKKRDDRLRIQAEKKVIEEIPIENITESTDSIDLLPPPPPPPLPPVVERSYKSHVEETLESIQSPNNKSIDESGKKYFRFSGYTLRYRLVETTDTNKQIKYQSRPKLARISLPFIPQTTSPLLSSSLSKSKTTITPSFQSRSLCEIRTPIPIRETRTSICRSARHQATPRFPPTVNFESKSDMKMTTITPINTIRRQSPKRTPRINTNYGYIPQQQPTVYNEPRRFVPVTLKSTAIGLPSDTPIIRD